MRTRDDSDITNVGEVDESNSETSLLNWEVACATSEIADEIGMHQAWAKS